MEAGKLRHRLTVKQLAGTKDGYGAKMQTWADVATVWAAEEPLIGREYFDAEAVQSEVTTKFRIRYRSDVRNEMRVQRGSEVFDILSAVNVNGLSRELLLLVKRVV